MLNTTLVIQLVASTMMAGLVLFVGVVHYPLMAAVGGKQFPSYQALHVQRTTWVVMPLMLAEAACAAALIFLAPSVWSLLGLALLAVVWATTFLVSVPAHRRLLDGFDPPTHRRLVWTHALRVVGWGARVPLAVAMVLA